MPSRQPRRRWRSTWYCMASSACSAVGCGLSQPSTMPNRRWPSAVRWSTVAYAAPRSSMLTVRSAESGWSSISAYGRWRSIIAARRGSSSPMQYTTNPSTSAVLTSSASLAGDPRHERHAELLLLAHGRDAVQQLDRRGVAERERERRVEDHADAAGAAARQGARLRVRTAVAELLRLGQHALAQLRGELVRAVERVGHRHPRNAERFGDGGECGAGAGHLYR